MAATMTNLLCDDGFEQHKCLYCTAFRKKMNAHSPVKNSINQHSEIKIFKQTQIFRMPKYFWRSLIKALLLWSVWVVCVLSILPVLLGVPGRPDFWEFALYIAVLTTVVGYALALPPILISKHRARLSGDGARVIALRRLARVAFILVIAVGSCVFYAFYRHEQSRTVLTQQELFANSFDNAILHNDTQWIERLIAEGASVDHPLSLGQTPALMSAEFGEWSLVLFLLNKGADPDRKGSSGLGVRSLATSPSRPVENPSEKSALDRVRALLDEK